MASTLPILTEEQRKAALEKAQAVRHERAELKARLKSGDLKLTDFLALESAAAKGMRVSQMLAALPGIGSKRAQVIMARLGIHASRRVGGLGSRQVAALVSELGE